MFSLKLFKRIFSQLSPACKITIELYWLYVKQENKKLYKEKGYWIKMNIILGYFGIELYFEILMEHVDYIWNAFLHFMLRSHV